MKTTIDMAREAGFKEHNGMVYITTINDNCAEELKAFADLVRADERKRIEQAWDKLYGWWDDDTEQGGTHD
jgi:hypothetical protein